MGSSEEIKETKTEPKVFIKLNDDIQIIRRVNKKFIRPDNTITTDAYRPRPNRDTTNVSTALKSCHNTTELLEKYNWDRCKIYETLTKYPHDFGYPCMIEKGGCHVGISGSMEELYENEAALEHIANNSKLIHPL